MSVKIDAHQHYWSPSRGDYGWLTQEAGLLYEDYLPERGAPELRTNGMRGSIVVQAAPTIAETEYLLHIAADEESILGVVGWVDLEDDRFSEQLATFSADPKFVGIRPNWPRDNEGSLLLSNKLIESLKLLASARIPVDLLLSAGELPDAVNILEAAPGLCIVIDHLGSPLLRDEDRKTWERSMSAIAIHTGAYCKLSGLITRFPGLNNRREALRPYVDHAIHTFGSDRLMFGSDWPVCRLAGEYADSVSMIEYLIQHLPIHCRNKIFGGTASAFYRIVSRQTSFGE